MTDIIEAVKQFTEAVGCTTDRYNVRQTALYLGLMAEEFAEVIEATGIGLGAVSADQLHQFSKELKRGSHDCMVAGANREKLLDGCVDLAWVTIGSAFSQGADVEGAAGEVMRANLSKLVVCDPCHGSGAVAGETCEAVCNHCAGSGIRAIKDENGKVRKPLDWTPPNIDQFVCKS